MLTAMSVLIRQWQGLVVTIKLRKADISVLSPERQFESDKYY